MLATGIAEAPIGSSFSASFPTIASSSAPAPTPIAAPPASTLGLVLSGRTSFRKDAQGFFILKDPDATLDYLINWSDANGSWLESDTIGSVQWFVDAGIAQVSSSNTSTTATIWLAGGTVGTAYNVTCRITTATGRIDDRSFRVIVQNR